MTAPDPRVGEIEARHRIIRRCLEAHPNDSYDMSDLDWAVEEAKDDVPYLLAELRKAHEALAAIHTVPPISHGIDADARFANGYNEALRRVRAAVAAAKGDERG